MTGFPTRWISLQGYWIFLTLYRCMRCDYVKGSALCYLPFLARHWQHRLTEIQTCYFNLPVSHLSLLRALFLLTVCDRNSDGGSLFYFRWGVLDLGRIPQGLQRSPRCLHCLQGGTSRSRADTVHHRECRVPLAQPKALHRGRPILGVYDTISRDLARSDQG